MPNSVHPPTLPTIRDVADAAGVSIGTASKALNGKGNLRQTTRERVAAAAEHLGFRANSLAQSLHSRRSFTVGLISTDSYGRFSIPLLEGLEQTLGDAQLSVFLCNAADDPERERQHVESLLAKRVDGIIVTSRRTDARPPLDLLGAGIPILYAYAQTTLNPDVTGEADTLCLLPDDEGGGRLAVEHLARLGRRRIAHITGPEHFEAVQLRRDAYLKVLAEQSLEAPAGGPLYGSWSEAWGREAVAELLSAPQIPDAIFCGSDQIARGVADALLEHGVRVPEQIALVGFDNWVIIAAATRPPLTTVDMNLHELGHVAARQMLALIEGRSERGVRRLPCRLVVRESCGAVRPTGAARP